MKGMEQLELHDGQLAGVSILAEKGSHLGDGPGGFAVCNMAGEEQFASYTTGHATGLWIWTSGGLAISSICCYSRHLRLYEGVSSS